ncbi:MAG: signal peptidase I [Planctomycetes bacterium]|nr:signal peptidase I [Planctomycetota bacterium]
MKNLAGIIIFLLFSPFLLTVLYFLRIEKVDGIDLAAMSLFALISSILFVVLVFLVRFLASKFLSQAKPGEGPTTMNYIASAGLFMLISSSFFFLNLWTRHEIFYRPTDLIKGGFAIVIVSVFMSAFLKRPMYACRPASALLLASIFLYAALMGSLLTVSPAMSTIVVFRVPSDSMTPTLCVDDKIVVNRLAYEGEPPRRWDVIVFRHPLGRDEYVVKRVIGIPGDVIGMKNGNLYLAGKILRKPADVQRHCWTKITRLETELKNTWDIGRLELGDMMDVSDSSLVVDTKQFAREIRVRRETLGVTGPSNEYELTRDVAFVAEFDPRDCEGEFTLEFEKDRAIAVDFKVADGKIEVRANQETKSYDTPGGVIARVEVECADGALRYRVAISGEVQTVELEADEELLDSRVRNAGVTFRGKFRFSRFEFARDVWYFPGSLYALADEGVAVPEARLLVLGDGSERLMDGNRSEDSRYYKALKVTLNDNTVAFCDPESLELAGGFYRVRNVDGRNLELQANQVVLRETIDYPFIERGGIVGRVIFVVDPDGGIRYLDR